MAKNMLLNNVQLDSETAFFTNGDIAKPYFVGCELERKRVECAIYMKAVELLEGEAE